MGPAHIQVRVRWAGLEYLRPRAAPPGCRNASLASEPTSVIFCYLVVDLVDPKSINMDGWLLQIGVLSEPQDVET